MLSSTCSLILHLINLAIIFTHYLMNNQNIQPSNRVVWKYYSRKIIFRVSCRFINELSLVINRTRLSKCNSFETDLWYAYSVHLLDLKSEDTKLLKNIKNISNHKICFIIHSNHLLFIVVIIKCPIAIKWVFTKIILRFSSLLDYRFLSAVID